MVSTQTKKPVGRPRGESSTIINIRVPVTLVVQLDRYLDWTETHTGEKVNRGTITRRALQEYLERHAADIT